MSRGRWTDQGLRWATLLALVLATLAPSVAHALRFARGDVAPWTTLCSATGSKQLVVDGRLDGTGDTATDLHSALCTACLAALGAMAPPPAPVVSIVVATGAPSVAAGIRASAPSTDHWPAALSRAPPATC
jgi:DUF2946 family protein